MTYIGAQDETWTHKTWLLKPIPMPIRLLAHIMGRDGVEPPEPKATGLQPVPLPLTVYLPIWSHRSDSNWQSTLYKSVASPLCYDGKFAQLSETWSAGLFLSPYWADCVKPSHVVTPEVTYLVPRMGFEPILHRFSSLLYVTIAIYWCCSPDYVFTISYSDLGGWYIVSTLLSAI